MTKTQVACAVVGIAAGLIAACAAWQAVVAAIAGWAGYLLALLASNVAFQGGFAVASIATWGITKSLGFIGRKTSTAIVGAAEHDFNDGMATAHYAH